MSPSDQSPRPGATAGLPGENAAASNSELSDDERDETVAMSEVARPDDDRDS